MRRYDGARRAPLGSLPVRIPSGDLAPARKHRRYGRRRRAPLPAVLVVLLLLAVAGAAYLLQRDDVPEETVAQATGCPTPTPAPAAPRPAAAQPAMVLPAPGTVRLRLLNGTTRSGLARTVGNELARRGFRVAGMGNAPAQLAGATRIAFGPGARSAATLVGVHVLGAQLVPVATAPKGSVDVVLGSSFVRLRNAAEVKAATQALAHPVTPVAAAPRPTPSCR